MKYELTIREAVDSVVGMAQTQYMYFLSKAKRASRVNPCLLSSNKCRLHCSIYITWQGRQEGAVLVHDRYKEAVKRGQTRSFFLNTGNKAAFRSTNFK